VRAALQSRRAALSRFGAERPEAWLYAIAAACWAVLILFPPASAAAAFCLEGSDRLAALSFVAGAALAGFEWPLALSHWLLMIGAMMLPMAAMAARFVAFRSFRRRRTRAMAGFLIGYVAVWLAAAPLYLAAGVAAHLAGGSILVPLGIALATAAAWQTTPAKRRALRQCHKTVPLPPSGLRADRAAVVFGLAHGRHCLASCWALMLVPAVAGHHWLPMLLVGLVAFCERRDLSAEPLRRPAEAWGRIANLVPALVPLRTRQAS
jgi:predicted metal-binding membrane protein